VTLVTGCTYIAHLIAKRISCSDVKVDLLHYIQVQSTYPIRMLQDNNGDAFYQRKYTSCSDGVTIMMIPYT